MLSFDRSSSSFHENDDDPFEIAISAPKGRSNRSRIDANEHIIAERKRREKLNQRLIELSSLVPGLKKKDKASILEDAINYIKHLQEKIKQLEEDMITKKKMSGSIESVVFIKKHQQLPSFDIHDHDYSNDPFLNVVDEGNLELSTLPEIEARRLEKDVMIRIHCEKHNGVLAKVLSELESLHLIVVNCSVFSFGNSTIYITIIAQVSSIFAKHSFQNSLKVEFYSTTLWLVYHFSIIFFFYFALFQASLN
ncbi:Transcription factor NAI1 [Linum perenne]